VAAVQPESQLGDDLRLDSLTRVELLSAIEQELGVYLEDTAVLPSTTVGDLEHMLSETAAAQRKPQAFMRWPLHPAVRVLGELAHQLVIFPAYHALYRIRVEGREHLGGLPHPAIIAANHNVHWDPPLVYLTLSPGRRLRLAIAAADDDVFGVRWKALLGPLLANAFRLSRETNIRASLEYMGKLMDRGFSIQIFPEGKMTMGGPIQPFKAGTGLLAVEADVPVVPVHVRLDRPSWLFQGAPFPRRGAVTVRVGAPLAFKPGTGYAEATAQLEAAVRALAEPGGGGIAAERQ
jgi:long-chain acyl-CoA synthetase